MREISLFVEDYGHEQVVGSLVHWLAHEEQVNVRLTWRNTRHGFGRVADEFKEYLRDLRQQGGPAPDLIVVATDANCKGLNERAREFRVQDAPAPITLAMPDPHVERWLLLDGAAFRAVFGVGCDAPDLRCSRDRYKTRLLEAIRNAGGHAQSRRS